MTYEFTEIISQDGLIRGELENGEGVVAIHDENWLEVDEDKLAGNWEEVTSTIVTEILNSPDQEATNTLSIKKERAVDILSESDIIRANHRDERRLQANLLIDYLISENVFERSGGEIIILESFSFRSDLESKLNTAAFLSTLIDKVKNTIDTAEKEADKIANLISASEKMEPGAEEATTEEILHDLKRITGSKVEPEGWDEYGDPIPPNGVDKEDTSEYQDLIGRLRAKDSVDIGEDGEESGEAQERVNRKINKLKSLKTEFEKGEYKVRQSAIGGIANVEEVMSSVEKAQEAAPDIFNGSPVGEEDTKEVAETVLGLADEYDVDVTGDSEVAGEETSTVITDEETEEAVSDDQIKESDSVDLFDDEAQYD